MSVTTSKHVHDYYGVDFVWGGYWECACGHRPTEDEWNAWAESRDRAGELGTCEDDAADVTPLMLWAPDEHRYIRLANRLLAGFLFVLTFAAGFLAALLWKGIS